jgi:hypothetical protein
MPITPSRASKHRFRTTPELLFFPTLVRPVALASTDFRSDMKWASAHSGNHPCQHHRGLARCFHLHQSKERGNGDHAKRLAAIREGIGGIFHQWNGATGGRDAMRRRGGGLPHSAVITKAGKYGGNLRLLHCGDGRLGPDRRGRLGNLNGPDIADPCVALRTPSRASECASCGQTASRSQSPSPNFPIEIGLWMENAPYLFGGAGLLSIR